MIVDGRKLADDIYASLKDEIREHDMHPTLAIITCAPTRATEQYLALKERKTSALGIVTTILRFPASSTTDDLLEGIRTATHEHSAVIVQLPLPLHIDRDRVIAAIPCSHDVDALREDTTEFLSPVVRACKYILEQYKVPIKDQFVTIIGNGKLVGLPLYHWFVRMGAHVSVVTKDTLQISEYTKRAHIIASGAGAPGLITEEMISPGVVILDAGTSEDGGEVRGDVDPTCAGKAQLSTPVPGGIGPVTVAMLLSNVVEASKRNREHH